MAVVSTKVSCLAGRAAHPTQHCKDRCPSSVINQRCDDLEICPLLQQGSPRTGCDLEAHVQGSLLLCPDTLLSSASSDHYRTIPAPSSPVWVGLAWKRIQKQIPEAVVIYMIVSNISTLGYIAVYKHVGLHS